MTRVRLQGGDIIIGIHGHVIEVISNTQMRYLESPTNPGMVSEIIEATDLYDFNYPEYKWRLSGESIVDRILNKYLDEH
jgi:hypothetical protein